MKKIVPKMKKLFPTHFAIKYHFKSI